MDAVESRVLLGGMGALSFAAAARRSEWRGKRGFRWNRRNFQRLAGGQVWWELS